MLAFATMGIRNVRGWYWLALCALAIACKGSDAAPEQTAFDPTGSTACANDGDCCPEGSSCPAVSCSHYQSPRDGELSICTKPCNVDADCTSDLSTSLACGVLADGSGGCLPAWSVGVPLPGIACVNGVPTACNAAGAEHCASCGCPDGQRCDIGTGCVPRLPVGEGCQIDADCESNHCGEAGHVCRVPVGAQCNDQNCDLCMTSSNGWSFCSRYCQPFMLSSCGEGATCRNLGGGQSGSRLCWPKCVGMDDPSCPVPCTSFETLAGATEYAC